MADPTVRADAVPSVAQLVLLAQAGDAAAFASLYRDFARTVHGIVLAHAGVADAEDLTQDVFVQAFAKLGALREPAAFPAWLCAAARNAATDRLRRRRFAAQRPADADSAEHAAPGLAPDEHLAQRETAQRVLACLARLPVAYRETLTLRLVEGLAGPEIAARTGLTHGSVRVNLTRGMALLRPLLAAEGLP